MASEKNLWAAFLKAEIRAATGSVLRRCSIPKEPLRPRDWLSFDEATVVTTMIGLGPDKWVANITRLAATEWPIVGWHRSKWQENSYAFFGTVSERKVPKAMCKGLSVFSNSPRSQPPHSAVSLLLHRH